LSNGLLLSGGSLGILLAGRNGLLNCSALTFSWSHRRRACYERGRVVRDPSQIHHAPHQAKVVKCHMKIHSLLPVLSLHIVAQADYIVEGTSGQLNVNDVLGCKESRRVGCIMAGSALKG
jgi:hypothetical protein